MDHAGVLVAPPVVASLRFTAGLARLLVAHVGRLAGVDIRLVPATAVVVEDGGDAHPGGLCEPSSRPEKRLMDCVSARAMLAVLRDTPARRRIAVLGEMLELGRWAEPLHREVGNYAAECGIDVLVGLRGAACYMLDAAKRSGLRADAAFFFDDPVPAGQLVRSLAQAGDAVLFKGSRGVHVELALQQFLASQEAGGG